MTLPLKIRPPVCLLAAVLSICVASSHDTTTQILQGNVYASPGMSLPGSERKYPQSALEIICHTLSHSLLAHKLKHSS